MAMSGKICLLLLLVSAALAVGTQDPELKQCRHQCKVQQQFDETQKQECVQKCDRYYQEKQRRQKEEGGRGGSSILDADDENPRSKTPVERLGECVSQCEQQRRQGRHQEQEREQEQYRQCQQSCVRQFEREQQQEEGQGGRDSYYVREREQEQEQEREQERGEGSPYVFQDRHFSAQLKSEHGTVRILQKFTERSELLRGIENYRVAMLEANPQTFVIPNHIDADVLFFVTQGRGTISLVRPEKRESFNIKRGDVVRIPAGITSYIINRDNNQKLVLAKLLRPVSTPGNFEAYYGPGGENPESFFKAFSTELLEAAFNTRKDRLQRIFGQQRQGIIVKASEEQIRALSRHEEGGLWPFGGESKGPFSLLEKQPETSNQYGSLHRVDADELRQLENLNVAVSYMNITQGSMGGPMYHSTATRIGVVVNGEGYFEMACPHLSQQSGGGRSRQQGGGQSRTTTSTPSYQKVRSRLQRGVVFVVPAGHPTAVVASNNQNLEIVGFEVNAKNDEKIPLAGRRNVISQFEREAMELAFGVSARQVKEVFSSQEEEFFFKGPRQQGGAAM